MVNLIHQGLPGRTPNLLGGLNMFERAARNEAGPGFFFELVMVPWY